MTELLDIYTRLSKQALGNYTTLGDNVCVSKATGLSLGEHCEARKQYCFLYHNQCKCFECRSMILAGETILSSGICVLSQVFKRAFPSSEYHSYHAKRRLLHMPIVFIHVGKPASGCSELLLMELILGANYRKVAEFLNARFGTQSTEATPNLTRSELQDLLAFAQSDRERECIRVAAFKASGLSSTAARKQWGLQNMTKRVDRVQKYIGETQDMRMCIEDLGSTGEKAILQTYGIRGTSDDESSDDSDISCEDDDSPSHTILPSSVVVPSKEIILKMLSESQYNWFEFLDQYGCDELSEEELECVFSKLMEGTSLNAHHKELLEQDDLEVKEKQLP